MLVAVPFHAMVNAFWALFPESGSNYDPAVTFAILAPGRWGDHCALGQITGGALHKLLLPLE